MLLLLRLRPILCGFKHRPKKGSKTSGDARVSGVRERNNPVFSECDRYHAAVHCLNGSAR